MDAGAHLASVRSSADVADPFRITGPAVISFSGGRTSGYMLHRILQAHGGTLPADVVVCFANTGREMPATLDFVRDCGAAWNVPIRWLEYRFGSNSQKPFTQEVDYETASRNAEPFEAMLAIKSVLPNPMNSMCTIELKIRTTERFLKETFCWSRWGNVIGMRADESERARKAIARGQTSKDCWHNLCPLYEAGIDEGDVFRFWRAQSFDLRLNGPWEGNCDGCFKKRRARLERMFLDHPDRMAWWIAQEAVERGAGDGGRFRVDRESYAEMATFIRDQGRIPFDPNEAALKCEDAGCGV